MAQKFKEYVQWVEFPQTIKVCSTCFNSSTDFYNPILRKETNLMSGLKCTACKIKWIPISVSTFPEDGKWYSIRERPLKPVVRICNKIKGQPCNNLAKCEYAHNQLEILSWLDEAAEEVVEERYARMKLECFVCEMKIKTYDELKKHIESKQHIDTAISKRLKPTFGLSESCSGPIRRLPKKPNDILLCSSVIKKTRCYRGTGCKNAHSAEEHLAWKESLKYQKECKVQGKNPFTEPKKPNYGNTKLGDYLNKTSTSSQSSYSQSNNEQFDPAGNLDSDGQDVDNYRYFSNKDSSFIQKIKRTFRSRGIDNCQKPSHIVVTEENGIPLKFSLTPNACNQKWRFRIRSTTSDAVKSVILYDHRKQFTISSVSKGPYKNSELNKLPVYLHNENIACRIGVQINTNDCIEIVVLFTPLFGEYKMYVLYELDSDKLFAQEISGRVMEENFLSLAKILKDEVEQNPLVIIQIKPHETVIWETSYKIFHFHRQDALTASKFQLMPPIEAKIKSGGYDTMIDRFKPEFYKSRFRQLLHLEEYEHRKLMLKYDIDNCPVTFRDVIPDKNRRSVYHITFQMKCHLFEGYGRFRPPELAHVIPKGSRVAYECFLPKGKFNINYDSMTFEIRPEAIQECIKCNGLAFIKFGINPKEYIRMHDAVEKVTFNHLFPHMGNLDTSIVIWRDNSLISFLEKSDLSPSQKKAMTNICDPRFKSVPSLISGAFGCGKTETLLICAQYLVISLDSIKVLICTRNNSCADRYIYELDYYFRTQINIIRYNALSRTLGSINDQYFQSVTNHSLTIYNKETDDTKFRAPTLNELKETKILVTTTMTLYNLIETQEYINLFTHIFIDEAAQIIEPETCIPLVLAGNKTKVVLVGDIYQTAPVISSKIARKFDFQMSLFERLYNLPEYNNESGLKACKTDLNENYRSPKEIVDFLSELFYDNKLKSHPPKLRKGPHNLAPMSFVHVNGREKQLVNSPSFFNEAEAAQIAKEIKLFLRCEIDPLRIAVLTTYHSQLQILRKFLRANGVSRDVQVSNLEIMQGLEADVIIVSTVRTIKKVKENLSLEDQLDLGLLNDEKQFNTILSRARGWVMVVGCAQTLTNVGDCSVIWEQYIRKCRDYNSYFIGDRQVKNFEYIEDSDSEDDDEAYLHDQPQQIQCNISNSLQFQNPAIPNLIPPIPYPQFVSSFTSHPQAKQTMPTNTSYSNSKIQAQTRLNTDKYEPLRSVHVNMQKDNSQRILESETKKITSVNNNQAASPNFDNVQSEIPDALKASNPNIQLQNNTKITSNPEKYIQKSQQSHVQIQVKSTQQPQNQIISVQNSHASPQNIKQMSVSNAIPSSASKESNPNQKFTQMNSQQSSIQNQSKVFQLPISSNSQEKTMKTEISNVPLSSTSLTSGTSINKNITIPSSQNSVTQALSNVGQDLPGKISYDVSITYTLKKPDSNFKDIQQSSIEKGFEASLLDIFGQQKLLLERYQQVCHREQQTNSDPRISYHINRFCSIGEQQLSFLEQQKNELIQYRNTKASMNTNQPQRPSIYTQNAIPYSPKQTIHNVRQPIHDPKQPIHDPKQPIHDPRQPIHDPRQPIHNPSQPIHDPRQPIHDPRQPIHDPRQPIHDPRQPIHDPRQPIHDPRQPIHDPRQPINYPRQPFYDPRQPISVNQYFPAQGQMEFSSSMQNTPQMFITGNIPNPASQSYGVNNKQI